MSKLTTIADADGKGQGPEHGCHGRHHDRPEAKQASLVDSIQRAQPALAFCVEREVDHHDRVLLHNADQQDHANKRHDTEFGVERYQGEQGAHAGGGQCG